jgi:hypothetical protein
MTVGHQGRPSSRTSFAPCTLPRPTRATGRVSRPASSRVGRGADVQGWWSAMTDLARPALAAAAILIFVAGAAVMRSRQLEASEAYTSIISASPPSIETAARSASAGDGDAVIDYIMSH